MASHREVTSTFLAATVDQTSGNELQSLEMSGQAQVYYMQVEIEFQRVVFTYTKASFALWPENILNEVLNEAMCDGGLNSYYACVRAKWRGLASRAV